MLYLERIDGKREETIKMIGAFLCNIARWRLPNARNVFLMPTRPNMTFRRRCFPWHYDIASSRCDDIAGALHTSRSWEFVSLERRGRGDPLLLPPSRRRGAPEEQRGLPTPPVNRFITGRLDFAGTYVECARFDRDLRHGSSAISCAIPCAIPCPLGAAAEFHEIARKTGLIGWRAITAGHTR